MTNVAKTWTHRGYFRRFSLSVEQYGEILIAQVFDGTKRGDAQPCYDIETSLEKVRRSLLKVGSSKQNVEECLSGVRNGSVRIEVKSKLARTPGGVASVVHCSDNKINGKGTHQPATHFAVILFAETGQAEHAWLFSNAIARTLRKKGTKSQYIPVSSLKSTPKAVRGPIVDIADLIDQAASMPIPPAD